MLPELVHLVKILPEPTFLVRSTGEIEMANAAAAGLSGVKASAIVMADLSGLVADPPEKVQQFLRLCSRSRQLVPGAFKWHMSDGRIVDIRCDGTVVEPRTESAAALLFLRCRPRMEASNQFALLNEKVTSLSREIFERKRAEQQRDELLQSERAARLAAERDSRMKDEFLSTLSHELRTPLNAILGWTQVLQIQPRLADDMAHGIDVIARNARAQKTLIEDLLDMSRIISGTVRLSVQRVDLAAVTRAAISSVEPAADAKGIRIQAVLDPLAGPVRGDPGRLQQVVWNLLSNAVKFTPRHGRVQVFLERINSHVEISVSDSGEGISPEFLPHVFDRFRQADASTTRRHGGLGLGLSIVKQIVELHGGTVRAMSRGRDEGSTFAVVLPLSALQDGDAGPPIQRVHPATEQREEEAIELPELPNLQGITVLVADDEPDARELVQRFLSQCHATIHTAASAADALKLLVSGRPDVLISDIGMPEVDGYELMRRVRALPVEQGGNVPAIALTAFARSQDRTRAMLAGYNVHVTKPIEAGELIATVGSLVGRTGRRLPAGDADCSAN